MGKTHKQRTPQLILSKHIWMYMNGHWTDLISAFKLNCVRLLFTIKEWVRRRMHHSLLVLQLEGQPVNNARLHHLIQLLATPTIQFGWRIMHISWHLDSRENGSDDYTCCYRYSITTFGYYGHWQCQMHHLKAKWYVTSIQVLVKLHLVVYQ